MMIPALLLAFVVDLWPGEGRPVIVRVETGTRIEYDATNVRTIKPGVVRVLRDTKIEGMGIGPVRRVTRERYHAKNPLVRSTVRAGDTFELLQPRADGRCFVRISGFVLETMQCRDDDFLDVESEPVIEWWIRVEGGKWLQVDGENVKVVDREY